MGDYYPLRDLGDLIAYLDMAQIAKDIAKEKAEPAADNPDYVMIKVDRVTWGRLKALAFEPPTPEDKDSGKAE